MVLGLNKPSTVALNQNVTAAWSLIVAVTTFEIRGNNNTYTIIFIAVLLRQHSYIFLRQRKQKKSIITCQYVLAKVYSIRTLLSPLTCYLFSPAAPTQMIFDKRKCGRN